MVLFEYEARSGCLAGHRSVEVGHAQLDCCKADDVADMRLVPKPRDTESKQLIACSVGAYAEEAHPL